MQFDSKSASLAAAAIAAVLASPLAASAGPAPAPQFTAEKCYGVAAAFQNDCQTSTHSCAGKSKQARDNLRPGGDLYKDRRWQPQENLTQASSGVAIVTKDQPIPCCNPGIGLRSQQAAEIAASRPNQPVVSEVGACAIMPLRSSRPCVGRIP